LIVVDIFSVELRDPLLEELKPRERREVL